MNSATLFVTIVLPCIVVTASVIVYYFVNKAKTETKIKELENKVAHHEKFITILEKKAMSALEAEFNSKQSTNLKINHKNGKR